MDWFGNPAEEDPEQLHKEQWIRYASRGDAERLQKMIDEEIGTLHWVMNGYNALHSCVRKGHLQVLRMLIDSHRDIARDVINQPTNCEGTENLVVVQLAAKYGHVDILRFLWQEHRDLVDWNFETKENQKHLIHFAGFHGKIEVLKFCIGENTVVRDYIIHVDAKREHPHLLLDVVYGGHEDILKYLMAESGVYEPEQIKTPKTALNKCNLLHVAALEDHVHLVRFLLDSELFDVDCTTLEGMCTPLHLAALEGNTGVLSCLIREYGARMDALTTTKQNLVHKMASKNRAMTYKEIATKVRDDAELLECYEVLSNAKDEKGKTPLHLAAERGGKEMIEVLCQCQYIEVVTYDADGKTPANKAFENGFKDLAAKLDHRR